MRIRMLFVSVMVVSAFGCSRQETIQSPNTTRENQKVAGKATDSYVADVPEGPEKADTAALEQQRFNQEWRQLQSFKAQEAARQQAAQQSPPTSQPAPPTSSSGADLKIAFVTGQKESFKGLDANAINAAPVNTPISGDVRGPSVLKAQVNLDRAHDSVGTIDGRWGRNSAIAVWWWQRTHGLEPTGDVDEATFRSIAQSAGGDVPAVTQYNLTADDVKGPFVTIPADVYEQQKLDCLCYESLSEKLAEQFHSTPDFLQLLNPDLKINDLREGATLNVPNVRAAVTANQADIAKVVVSIAGNSFNAFDGGNNLIFHAPTTIGSTFDPSPDETVTVVQIVDHPQFHYDPTLYSDVPHSNPDAHLKPGPNSPVGVVWMALSKPHYGIHGTKAPETIGYASSHGCIRLTNWDAAEVQHRIRPGVPVSFVDPGQKGLPEVAKK